MKNLSREESLATKPESKVPEWDLELPPNVIEWVFLLEEVFGPITVSMTGPWIPKSPSPLELQRQISDPPGPAGAPRIAIPTPQLPQDGPDRHE